MSSNRPFVAGIDTRFEVVHGAGHGGAAFFEPARISSVAKFLEATLAPHPQR